MAKITNPEELRTWLEGRPREIAQAFAVRIALRVFPLIGASEKRQRLTAAVVRALFISRAAAVFPARDMSAAARAARAAAAAARAAYAAHAAAAAAAAAAAYAARAAYAAADAARAAYAAHAAAAAAYAAHAADAEWVEQQGDGAAPAHLSRRLLDRPLWPTGDPEGLSKAWQRMKVGLTEAGEDWDIWTDWYDNRLAGRPYDFSLLPVAEADVVADIAMGDEAFWGRPAAEVNGEIKARLLAARPQDLEPVPGAHQIRAEKDRLNAYPAPLNIADAAYAEDMLEGLRKLVASKKDACEKVQDNDAVTDVFDELEQLLGQGLNNIRAGQLQVQMRMVQSLAAVHDDPKREADKTVRSALNAIAEGLGDFLALSKSVRDMEASRAAMLAGSIDQPRLQAALRQFRDVAAASPHVDASVVAALDLGDAALARMDVLANPIGEPPAVLQKIIEQRSSILGQKLVTVWNVAAATVKAGASELAGRAWKGVGNGVEKTFEGLTGLTFAALAVHLGVPIALIGVMVPSFLTAKAEVKKLEQQIPTAAKDAQ